MKGKHIQHSYMKINFNNVRKQAIYAYEKLVNELNSAIIKNDQWAKPNDVYHDKQINIKGYVLVDAEAIQKCIDTLRITIGTIGMAFEEENEDFRDVYQEIYPEENKKRMPCFNQEEE